MIVSFSVLVCIYFSPVKFEPELGHHLLGLKEIAKKKNSGDNKANGPSGKDSGANEKKKKTLEKETAEKDAESNISILNIQIAIIRKASKHPSADR